MTTRQWHNAADPKVKGSWNLHMLLPKELDFFVMLSSCVGVAGVHGQSNYAAGNTYQDALARTRVSEGYKAVTIDLGVVEDMGFVSQDAKLGSILKSAGHLALTKADVLLLLEYYCNLNNPGLSPLESQLVTGLQLPSTFRALNLPEPRFLAQPMFYPSHQIGSDGDISSSTVQSRKSQDIRESFSRAENLSDIEDVISDALREKLSAMLVIDKANIDPRNPLHTYGVDSLVAMEIRSWFSLALSAEMAVLEILGNGSTAELSKEVAMRSRLTPHRLKVQERYLK